MAYAAVKYCGLVLLYILLVLQQGTFSYFQVTGLLHSLRLWQVIASVLALLYSLIVPSFSAIFLLDATLNDSIFFPGYFLDGSCTLALFLCHM